MSTRDKLIGGKIEKRHSSGKTYVEPSSLSATLADGFLSCFRINDCHIARVHIAEVLNELPKATALHFETGPFSPCSSSVIEMIRPHVWFF